jgi:hypothetical protein
MYKLDGYHIVAFGSTAKFNTLLNSISVDNSLIDYIIDENRLKEGLLTPGSNILVVPISTLSHIKNKTVIIVSAWNFYNEIKYKIISYLEQYKRSCKLLNINPLHEESLTFD